MSDTLDTTTKTLTEIVDSMSLEELQSELAKWKTEEDKTRRAWLAAKGYQELYRIAIQYKNAKAETNGNL